LLKGAPDATPEALGDLLMAGITRVVPMLPVPLVAAALLDGATDRVQLRVRLEVLVAELGVLGAVIKLPPQGLDATLAEGLAPLVARGLVADAGGVLGVKDDSQAMIAFYAGSVRQRLGIDEAAQLPRRGRHKITHSSM
jgi:glycerol-3-phosphate O-acyltransferase